MTLETAIKEYSEALTSYQEAHQRETKASIDVKIARERVRKARSELFALEHEMLEPKV